MILHSMNGFLIIIFIQNMGHMLASVLRNQENFSDKSSNVKEVTQRFEIIVDAGSSGSRMFVYSWTEGLTDANGLLKLEIYENPKGYQIVKKVTPGISELINNLGHVETYISELLDFAKLKIPVTSHRNTPVYIFATAGMRLLTLSEQEEIWSRVRNVIKHKYDFKFSDNNARTISGQEEALFGWVAVNCILERFGFNGNEGKQISTYGMLDMGGASMQISFEDKSNKPIPADLYRQFVLRTSKPQRELHYKIYLHSYLSYGANEMRNRYERYLLYEALKNGNPQNPLMLKDNCLLAGLATTTKEIVPRGPNDFKPPGATEKKYQVQFEGAGNYDLCSKSMQPLFDKQANCGGLPCAVGDVGQPPIDFKSAEFYGLTEFSYSFEDLLKGPIYDHKQVSTNTKTVCAKDWNTYEKELRAQHAGKPVDEINAIVNRKQLVCFKASYLISMLHFGLHFPEDYNGLRPIITLAGSEVQWSLGALFYQLNAIPQSEMPPYLLAIFCSLSVLTILLVIVFITVLVCKHKRNRAMASSDVEQPERQHDTLDSTQTSLTSPPVTTNTRDFLQNPILK